MEVKALQQLLSQFRQIQENLQKQVDSVSVEASAGGGMVVVKMNGQKQVTDVRIEQEVFAAKDSELLQDLIRAAVNEACRRVDEELASQMKGLGSGLPGLSGLKNPGLFCLLHVKANSLLICGRPAGSCTPAHQHRARAGNP